MPSANICELSSEQRFTLRKIVDDLVIPEGEVYKMTLTEHNISVTDNTPIKHNTRRISQTKLEWMIAEVKKMLYQGIIEIA